MKKNQPQTLKTESNQLNDTELTVVEPTVDVNNPKEGDVVINPNGDREVFTNGTWIVYVSHSPRTGEES